MGSRGVLARIILAKSLAIVGCCMRLALLWLFLRLSSRTLALIHTLSRDTTRSKLDGPYGIANLAITLRRNISEAKDDPFPSLHKSSLYSTSWNVEDLGGMGCFCSLG